MLSGFMFDLSNTQLRKSWKPLVINALAEELDSSGALYKHKGLLSHFMRCLEVVHDRFIRIDSGCLDPNTDTPSR